MLVEICVERTEGKRAVERREEVLQAVEERHTRETADGERAHGRVLRSVEEGL